VADISNEAILGMDFLVSNNCDVLLSQNKLSVKGEIIQCFHYASNAKYCYRVAIQETTEVPPNSEIFISGKPRDPIFRSTVGLVELNEKLVEKNGLLVARSIVNPEMDNIPLRIINVNSEPCTLYKVQLLQHAIRLGKKIFNRMRLLITWLKQRAKIY
jgi:hypothetical protein